MKHKEHIASVQEVVRLRISVTHNRKPQCLAGRSVGHSSCLDWTRIPARDSTPQLTFPNAFVVQIYSGFRLS